MGLLDGACKLLLCHGDLCNALAPSQSVGSGGGRNKGERMTITVSRSTVLQDVSDALHASGAVPSTLPDASSLQPPSQGTARLLNPLFASSMQISSSGGGRESASPGGGGAVEDGEGHGPRKELLQLLGQECVAAYSEWVPGTGEISGAEGRPKLSGRFLTWATSGCMIRGKSGRWEATVVSLSADHTEITLNGPLPCTVVHETYEYCRRLNPLLLPGSVLLAGASPLLSLTACSSRFRSAAR